MGWAVSERAWTVGTSEDPPVVPRSEAGTSESLRRESDHLDRSQRELVDRANDIIYTHDLHGNFTSMNARGEQILGYTSDEIVAMNIADVMPPDQLEIAMGRMAEEHRDGRPTTHDVNLLAKTGELVPLEVSTSGIFRDGVMIGVLGIARAVSGRRAVRAELEASERRFRALVELAGDVKMLVTTGGIVSYVSPGIERILGHRPEDRVGRSIFEFMHGDDVPQARHTLSALVRDGGEARGEVRVHSVSGEVHWLAFEARSALHEPGIEGVVVNYFDVTERRRDEERLRTLATFQDALISLVEESLTNGLTESFYGRVLRCAVDVIPGAQAGSLLLRDDQGRCTFAATVGFDQTALQGTYLKESELHRDPTKKGPQIVRGFEGNAIQDEARRKRIHDAGRVETIAVTLSIPIELDGEPMAYFHLDNFDDPDVFGQDAVQMARAFSNHIGTLLQRFRLEADLRQERAALDALAHSDELTGLPNRTMFYRRSHDALASLSDGKPVAVFFFDLDAFKRINDTHGHQFGDLLLQAVANRLLAAVRDRDTVSRWGGDEFVLLLPDVGSLDHAKSLAQRIIDRINRPYSIADQAVSIGCCIGVSYAEATPVTIDELTREADIALYRAKADGRNCFRVYQDARAPGTSTEGEAP